MSTFWGVFTYCIQQKCAHSKKVKNGNDLETTKSERNSHFKFHFSFFQPLGLCSGIIFLIVLFPDHCLIVPLYI